MSSRNFLAPVAALVALAACSNSTPDYCGKTCGVNAPCSVAESKVTSPALPVDTLGNVAATPARL